MHDEQPSSGSQKIGKTNNWNVEKSLLIKDWLKFTYIYLYIRVKIKPNSVRIRFLSCQILPNNLFISEMKQVFTREQGYLLLHLCRGHLTNIILPSMVLIDVYIVKVVTLSTMIYTSYRIFLQVNDLMI